MVAISSYGHVDDPCDAVDFSRAKTWIHPITGRQYIFMGELYERVDKYPESGLTLFPLGPNPNDF
jgi:hypothetical protein